MKEDRHGLRVPVKDKRLIKGRGSLSNPAGRFDKTTCVAVDDGWEPVEDESFPSPDPRTEFFPDRTRNIIATNQVPRHPLRPVDQSLQGLRAWLHLLLRPADPCVSRSVARTGLRIEDFLQNRAGGAAPESL